MEKHQASDRLGVGSGHGAVTSKQQPKQHVLAPTQGSITCINTQCNTSNNHPWMACHKQAIQKSIQYRADTLAQLTLRWL